MEFYNVWYLVATYTYGIAEDVENYEKNGISIVETKHEGSNNAGLEGESIEFVVTIKNGDHDYCDKASVFMPHWHKDDVELFEKAKCDLVQEALRKILTDEFLVDVGAEYKNKETK